MKKDNLIKDSFILFVGTSVVNLSNFVFHMYVTRKLGPELYGVLATLLGITIIIMMPAQALQVSIVKKVSVFKARNNLNKIKELFFKTTKWFIFLGGLYFLVFILFVDYITNFFKINDKVLIYILGGISLIALLLPVVRGILQGLQKFVGLGVNLIFDALLRLFFVVVLLHVGLKVRGALLPTLLSGLTAYIIGIFMIKEIFKYKYSKNKVINKKEFFSYALPVFLSMFGFSILSYMDLFIVKHFFSEKDAGLYAVISIIGKAFLYFPMAIAMALFPKVSEQFELKENTEKLLYKSLFLTFFITLIGFLFCFSFPKFVIFLLTGGGEYYQIIGIVKIFGIFILPLVLINVIINYNLAIHNYIFLYIMYSGIITYGIILWFFHDTFFHVISVLFFVNLIILILSLLSIKIKKKVKNEI